METKRMQNTTEISDSPAVRNDYSIVNSLVLRIFSMHTTTEEHKNAGEIKMFFCTQLSSGISLR
ncbi:hypothetical protein EON73_02275 [bacterium]|nr:MAG: hypothetical protein EON73_02275 [bacterium]